MVLFFNGFCFNGVDVGYDDFVYIDGVSDDKRIKELVEEYKDVKDLIALIRQAKNDNLDDEYAYKSFNRLETKIHRIGLALQSL